MQVDQHSWPFFIILKSLAAGKFFIKKSKKTVYFFFVSNFAAVSKQLYDQNINKIFIKYKSDQKYHKK